ncbi:MAG TPA: hypothetical protein VLG44_02475 [Chlamydiales bacterium]|nr:hypothetical protein [Chlamydiales bacterium]
MRRKLKYVKAIFSPFPHFGSIFCFVAANSMRRTAIENRQAAKIMRAQEYSLKPNKGGLVLGNCGQAW